MATIPMGNFGQSVAVPQRGVQRSADEFGAATGRALEQLGNTGTQIVVQQMAARTRLDDQERDQQESSSAMESALKFEASAGEKARELVAKIQSGQIEPEAAKNAWTEELILLRENSVGKLLNSKYSTGAMQHTEQVSMRAWSLISEASGKVVQQRNRAQANSALDSLGKVAMLPGEDLDVTLAKADQVFPTLAQRAGMDQAQAATALQTWKDNTRFQRARIDLVDSRRSVESLDAFTQRLESGDLVGKLDPDKRVMLVKEAESYKWQLQQSAQHAVDKQEKIAERAIASTTRQIEAGVPLSVEAWEDLRNKVAGTPFANDFNSLVSQERETQKVLRLPIGQQEQYVQQRDAALAQNGGTMVDRANLQRIKATIATNKKELEQAPLLAAQRLLGRKFEPLNVGDLLAPGGTHRAAAVFADRTATLQAMSRQFGTRVGQRPLLPQEKEALMAGLDLASPSEAVGLFGSLRAAIDDDGSYRAAMQQIAPDSPVRARAGILAAAGRHVTLQENYISNDVRVPGAKIAQTMMAGEAILNRSKKQKAEDGQARTLFAPTRDAFSQGFADVVGDLYRGRPGAQEQDLQAAYAYYVGRAAELGTTSDGTVDSPLAKEAITATLGAVVNLNGQGRVTAPLGMSASDFESKAREQFVIEARRRNLPTSMLDEWPHFGLQAYRRDGTYVLTQGGLPVVDPASRKPVVIDLDPPPPSGLRFRSAADLIPNGDAPSGVNGGAKR